MEAPPIRIDLHAHTTASDGRLGPTALVRAAQEAGIGVLAVTDHDTVDGLAEAEAEARAAGLRLIPGIELSTYWRRVELHILGYFIDPRHPGLLAFLASTRGARVERLHAMVARLFRLGLAVTADEALAETRDGNVGRPHLARVLVRRGYVASTDEAFDRYLGTDRPAYVPRPDVSIAEAIRVVHEAGGLAAWAHPGLHERDDALPELMAAGLDALEVYHPNHLPPKAGRYRRLAAARRLLVTGGSDYHGAEGGVHAPTLGTPRLPEPELRRLEAALEARRAAAS
jgi:predicted metal-dependent phosphoesterase TrpH